MPPQPALTPFPFTHTQADGQTDTDSAMRPLPVEGHTHVEGQVRRVSRPDGWILRDGCMDTAALLLLLALCPTREATNDTSRRQIDAMAILPQPFAPTPLIALASSRLEGATWDGAITLLHAQHKVPSSSVTLTRAGPVCPLKYGVPALAWCGGGRGSGGQGPILAAAQDNGNVEVRVRVGG